MITVQCAIRLAGLVDYRAIRTEIIGMD